ncbi:MAG: SpoIIE family protein phosphatase [Phycisphaerales bacterium]|nr:SpoIIE family protein phosphatase [Phycisphaerales bacterium]
MRPVSIRFRFLRDLVLLALLMGGAALLVFWVASRRAIRTHSASIIRQTLETTERELESFFDPVGLSLQVARGWGESGALSLMAPSDVVGAEAAEAAVRERLVERFIAVVRQLPRISSLLVADETGREFMLLHTARGFEVWQTRPREDGGFERRRTWSDWNAPPESRLDYDPLVRPWFNGAMENLRRSEGTGRGAALYWTEPYTFFTTHDPGITASIAMRDPAGRAQVVGFDILLADISEFTRSLRVGQRGKIVVMTTDDLVVGLPGDARFADPEVRRAAYLREPHEIGLDLARDATRAFGDAVVKAIQENRSPEGLTVRFQSLDEAWWGEAREFSLAPDRRLRIAVVVPEAELLGDIAAQRLTFAGILAALLLVGVWRAIVLGRTLSRPVEQLVAQSDRIGRGDLSPPQPIATDISEVQRLAAAHERMRESLRSLMRLERDLQIARQIQQSTLPRTLPALDGFDLAAWNEPAEETGGDTFDVIAVEGEGAARAVLLLADATGHGIGPALAATQIRAMLRMAVRLGADLADVARHLNEQLLADLPDNRFITAWLGEVDARAGTIASFSAGQGPILIYRAALGAFERRSADAPPFGVVDDMAVNVAAPVALERGDLFIVISDGFYEARDAAGEQFGPARVERTIASHAGASAAAIIAAVREAVDAFTHSKRADDDRTIIVIRRTG